MSTQTIFQIQLVLGYVTCLLFFSTYALPKLKAMDRFEAQRAIATLHSFRFFGLVFIVPGVVGPNLPAGFAPSAAYVDFATGSLAILALLTARMRPVFWSFVVAFNLVGATDILVDYYHATRLGLPALAGQLGATYVIPILYVPMLMITHAVALYWLVRPRPGTVRVFAGDAPASQPETSGGSPLPKNCLTQGGHPNQCQYCSRTLNSQPAENTRQEVFWTTQIVSAKSLH